MKGLRFVLGLLVVVAALSSSARAQRLDAIFEEANQAQFAGELERAAQGYERLVEAGVDDPDVNYNLATAYARAGRLGHAVWWYERALRLRPDDEEAAVALASVRAELGRQRVRREGEALVEIRPPFTEALVRPFSERFLAVFVLLSNFAFFGLLLVFPRVRAEARRLGVGIAIPIVGLLLLASSVGLAVKREVFAAGASAIALSENAPLREGPDPRAKERGEVAEGQRLRVKERDSSWVRVDAGGGRSGWLPAEAVGEI